MIKYRCLCKVAFAVLLSQHVFFDPLSCWAEGGGSLASSKPQDEPRDEEKASPAPALQPSYFKESVQQMSVDEQWATSGFRLSLSYLYGGREGIAVKPGGSIKGVYIGIGARLDADWSVDGGLSYALISGDQSGLAFSGQLGPALHWGWASLGFYVGVMGLNEQRQSRPENHPSLSTEVVASYTLPDTAAPLSACVGFGPMSGISLQVDYPLGETSAVHLGARASVYRLGCEQNTERVEPDTAEAIVLRQYWRGVDWGMMGGFSWR